jgi:Polyketide cyclase / dehydrase and lipid transport
MTVFTRVQTFRSAELDVPAGAFWDVLLDWPAIMSWWPKDNPPAPLIRVDIREGHTPGELPLTRDCFFDTSQLPPGIDPSLLPDCVPETLLYVDETARMLYYNMEGIGPFGMRNYLAITEVDDLGDGRCRATCRGRFDLPEGAPEPLVKGFIEGVYEAILGGISARAASEAVAAT